MTHPDLLKTGPAQFTISKEMMRTRYVIVIIRTEVFDGSDSNDIKEIHGLQVKFVNLQHFHVIPLFKDAIQLTHHLEGSLDGIPEWDQASYEQTRDAVQALADTWPNLDGFNALGWYDDVDPTKVRLKSLSDVLSVSEFLYKSSKDRVVTAAGQ